LFPSRLFAVSLLCSCSRTVPCLSPVRACVDLLSGQISPPSRPVSCHVGRTRHLSYAGVRPPLPVDRRLRCFLRSCIFRAYRRFNLPCQPAPSPLVPCSSSSAAFASSPLPPPSVRLCSFSPRSPVYVPVMTWCCLPLPAGAYLFLPRPFCLRATFSPIPALRYFRHISASTGLCRALLCVAAALLLLCALSSLVSLVVVTSHVRALCCLF